MASSILPEWFREESKRDRKRELGLDPDKPTSYKPTFGVCVVCGEWKRMRAKGMCDKCYREDYFKRTGKKL